MIRSKKYTNNSSKYDKCKEYTLSEAVDFLVGFDLVYL